MKEFTLNLSFSDRLNRERSAQSDKAINSFGFNLPQTVEDATGIATKTTDKTNNETIGQ